MSSSWLPLASPKLGSFRLHNDNSAIGFRELYYFPFNHLSGAHCVSLNLHLCYLSDGCYYVLLKSGETHEPCKNDLNQKWYCYLS